MRDQNSVQAGNVFSDYGQALGDFTAAQPGIDQDARAIRSDKGRIARTRGCEDADFDDGRAPA
jgi:hypothetical protein